MISEVHDEKESIQEAYFDLIPLLLVPRVLCDGEEAKEPKAEPVENIAYNIPKPMEFSQIAEHCNDLHAFKERWILSGATKDGAEDSVAKYDSKWQVEAAAQIRLRGGLGPVLKTMARHHAIIAKLDKP